MKVKYDRTEELALAGYMPSAKTTALELHVQRHIRLMLTKCEFSDEGIEYLVPVTRTFSVFYAQQSLIKSGAEVNLHIDGKFSQTEIVMAFRGTIGAMNIMAGNVHYKLYDSKGVGQDFPEKFWKQKEA